jgi:hypothetical protein
VSKEKDGSKRHGIIPDGYNVGRNLLVEKAIAGSNWKGMWWKADVEWKAGLLEPGKDGRSAILSHTLDLIFISTRCESCHRARWPCRRPHRPQTVIKA